MWNPGQRGTAHAALSESLALFEALEHHADVALVHFLLGSIALSRGEQATAKRHLETSRVLRQASGDRQGLAWTLGSLGQLALGGGDIAAAMPLLTEALVLSREVGDRWGISRQLTILGMAAQGRGDFEEAWSLFEESLAMFQGGQNVNNFINRIGQSMTALLWGKREQARATLTEVLTSLGGGGQGPFLADVLLGLGLVRAWSSPTPADARRALQLFASAEACAPEGVIATTLLPWVRAAYERVLESCRVCLGEESAAAAWAEGQAMTVMEAREYALTDGLSAPNKEGGGSVDDRAASPKGL